MATIGNYRINKIIAQGGFANIYQAQHIALDELACIKQCRVKSDDYAALLREEAKILWKLHEHHSIPHSKDFIKAPDGSHVMVMSYIDGKTIDKLVPDNSRMHEEDACWITQRLLEALYYCHYNGVIHSDIKPSNVIVEPKKHDIKLIDFGLAVYKPKGTTNPLGYTAAFVAPELLEGKPPIPETDLYGAGLVMLYALGGNVETKAFPKDISFQVREFCTSLLRYDPLQRPNWEKQDIIQKLADIRQEVFGRKHTEAYSKTKM
jgi:serine/threonine-protein kinase